MSTTPKNYLQLEEWSKIALGNGCSSNAVEIEMENKWYAYECSIFFMTVCMREYFFLYYIKYLSAFPKKKKIILHE